MNRPNSPSPLRRRLDFRGLAATAAVFLLAALPSSAVDATYRYFRFKPTKISNSGDAIQLSEFTFAHAGANLDRTGVLVTSGNLDPNGAEGPLKLVDGLLDTKFLRGGATANGNELVFDFGKPTTIDSYNIATGNDNVLYEQFGSRTVVSWRLYGSDDNNTWNILDVRTDVPNINADLTFYSGFPLQAAVPPTIDSYNIRNTGTEGTAGIVLNGQSVTFDYATSFNTTRLLYHGATSTPLSDLAGSTTQTPPNNSTSPYTLVAAQGDPTVVGTPTAASTILVRTVVGGSATFKYVRYTVTGRRGTGNGLVQVSEFEFFNGLSSIAANKKTIVSATNVGGRNEVAADEGANKLFDGNPNSKWLENDINIPVIFYFGETPVTFDRYAFTTGGDAPDRDPVTWTLEGSDDETTWTLLEKVDFGYPTPANRNLSSREIPLPGASLPAVISQFAAGPGSLISGDTATISYSVQDVNLTTDSITLTGSTGGTFPAITTATGTIALSGANSPTADTTYTLTVSKPGGSTVTATSAIKVIADPGNITLQFDDFATAAGSFAFTGSTAITASNATYPNRLRLTPATPSQLGAAWILKKQNVTQGFEATFGLSMNIDVPSPGAPPADGTAFVIQNSAAGNGNLGTGEGGVSTNALNICFRTFGFGADPASRIEVRSGTEVLAFAIAATKPGVELYGVPGFPYTLASQAADPAYRIRVVYVPGNLDVYLDGIAVIQNVNVNLQTIGAADANGGSYIGFTGRTGGNVQNNDITDWHLNLGDFSAVPPYGLVKYLFKSSTGTGPIDTIDLVWNARATMDYEVLNTIDLTDEHGLWSRIGSLITGVDGQLGISYNFIAVHPDDVRSFFSVHELPK